MTTLLKLSATTFEIPTMYCNDRGGSGIVIRIWREMVLEIRPGLLSDRMLGDQRL